MHYIVVTPTGEDKYDERNIPADLELEAITNQETLHIQASGSVPDVRNGTDTLWNETRARDGQPMRWVVVTQGIYAPGEWLRVYRVSDESQE